MWYNRPGPIFPCVSDLKSHKISYLRFKGLSFFASNIFGYFTFFYLSIFLSFTFFSLFFLIKGALFLYFMLYLSFTLRLRLFFIIFLSSLFFTLVVDFLLCTYIGFIIPIWNTLIFVCRTFHVQPKFEFSGWNWYTKSKFWLDMKKSMEQLIILVLFENLKIKRCSLG